MMAGEFVTLLDDVWDELRADADPRFDPPHSTVQATVISGGTAVNILAREARGDLGISLPARPRSAKDHGHACSDARRQPKSCPNIAPRARKRRSTPDCMRAIRA